MSNPHSFLPRSLGTDNKSIADSAEKPSVHPSTKHVLSVVEGLRANGEGLDNVNYFPFMLSLVEAFLGFFSRIK